MVDKWRDRMCTPTHILSLHFSRICEATQSCAKVIRQNLQAPRQNLILSLLFIENRVFFVLTNSSIWSMVWSPYNFFLEGVVFHEKSGIEIEYMKLGKL